MSEEHNIDWDDDKILKLWNYYSRTPPYSENYFAKVFGDQILLKSRLPLRENISVLDFGCGPGFIWDHLIKLGIRWSYSGVDFSSESVDKVKRKADGHPQFRGVMRVTKLPCDLPTSSFDAVLLIEVVEHLKDDSLEEIVAEVYRVIKPGGIVVITTPNEEDLARGKRYCPECGAIFHEWQHVRSWSAPYLSEFMRSRGFERNFVSTLDFSGQNIFRALVNRAKRLWSANRTPPHMIGSFRSAKF